MSVYVTSRPVGTGSARSSAVTSSRTTAGGSSRVRRRVGMSKRYVAGALPGAAKVKVKPSPHGTTLPPSMGGKIL